MTTEMVPSASRLMESLRDIGYDLSAAVADLVDNSLDADAENVSIDVGQGSGGEWLRIADDGSGMSEGQLDEAMRYGSSRAYGASDLGHFGLGLKTASLSQGRCLTVATRSTTRGPIRIRRWDLDRVIATDSWHLERLGVKQCSATLTKPLVGRTGTVVLWERLDRVLGSRRAGGEAAARRLEAAAEAVATHLAMVFHRFLAGEAPGPPLSIHVAGRALTGWDPFARDEALTKTLARQALPLNFDGQNQDVVVQPYVLPAQHHFSSPEAHALAGGPRRWNRQQGLYIYRHDRLIQSGGWNRLRTMDEHSKLARIAVDIPVGADAAFRINVSKMAVGLPESIRAQMRALVGGVVSRAQDAYRRRLAVVEQAETVIREHRQSGSITVGDQWPAISDALARHLGDQPELLDRLLVDLANVRPSTERASRLTAGTG